MSPGKIGCAIVCCAMLWGCVGPPKPVPTNEKGTEGRSEVRESSLPRQARSVRLETETGTLSVSVELALTRGPTCAHSSKMHFIDTIKIRCCMSS